MIDIYQLRRNMSALTTHYENFYRLVYRCRNPRTGTRLVHLDEQRNNRCDTDRHRHHYGCSTGPDEYQYDRGHERRNERHRHPHIERIFAIDGDHRAWWGRAVC